MKRSATCIVLTVLMSLLSGCLQNFKNRDCPSFDNPLAKQWQPVEAGSTVVLTHADGESAVYLLQSIILSQPYVATLDVNSSGLDGPECEMTSKHVFSAEDGSHEIILDFLELDNDDANPAPDSLGLTIAVTLPADEFGEQGRLLSRTQSTSLPTPLTNVEDDNFHPRFFASRTLENGQNYTDVIVFPNGSIPPEPDFEAYLLSEVLLSRNVGLIQISRDSGGMYTLVPE